MSQDRTQGTVPPMSNKRSQQKMDAIRLRQAEKQLGVTPEKKRMMRKEARRQARRDRTDEYWRDPLPYRVYVRGLYSVCGGILVGVLFDRLGSPMWLQWIAFGLSSVFIACFRLIFSNGLRDMFSGVFEAIEANNDELAVGNYDGVPKFVQDAFDLPARQEEIRKQQKMIRKMQARKASRQSMAGQMKRKKR